VLVVFLPLLLFSSKTLRHRRPIVKDEVFSTRRVSINLLANLDLPVFVRPLAKVVERKFDATFALRSINLLEAYMSHLHCTGGGGRWVRTPQKPRSHN
jgi:hypothetical protein